MLLYLEHLYCLLYLRSSIVLHSPLRVQGLLYSFIVYSLLLCTSIMDILLLLHSI